jgi:hypothetical protein
LQAAMRVAMQLVVDAFWKADIILP